MKQVVTTTPIEIDEMQRLTIQSTLLFFLAEISKVQLKQYTDDTNIDAKIY